MFLLNLQSKIPIYLQIQEQMMKFIQAGILHPGDKLPSVRQLASENGINPNTVAKAYSELEKGKIVYNLPKKGVYVAEVDVVSSRRKSIETVLMQLKDNGVTKQEVLDVLEFVYQGGMNDAENL